MLGWFLIAAVVEAIKSGECANEEDYCNQNGCNYDEIYYQKNVSDDDDWDDSFVGFADDDD